MSEMNAGQSELFCQEILHVLFTILMLRPDDKMAIVVKFGENKPGQDRFNLITQLTPSEMQDSVDFLTDLNNHAELDAQQVLANIKGLNHG